MSKPSTLPNMSNLEAAFIGAPLFFKRGVYIYPPTIKQVVGNEKYSLFERLLTYSQEEIEDDFVEKKKTLDKYPTPFEFLFQNSFYDKEYEQLSYQAFEFFLQKPVIFLYDVDVILIDGIDGILSEEKKTLDDLVFITKDEFFDFQNMIRQAVGKKVVERPNPNEHPKIKAMKAKARYRDRIKAKQGKGISLYTSIVSICCMGIGITPLNIGEMSYAALEPLTSRFQEKEKYQLDIDSLLAGGDSKKINPKYWIRNLEE